MDLISNRTIEITKMAMDGLMARQKATTANIANVMTPDYKRKEVDFESQLREIVEKDDLKTYIKEQNSLQYNPSTLNEAVGTQQSGLTPQQQKFLKTDVYSAYNPQITDDFVSGSDETGNNVNIEQEVMHMTDIGLRYQTLASLEGKILKLTASAIRGDVQ